MKNKETLLTSLGFELTEGYDELYTHSKFNEIKIDMSVKNGKIDYPKNLIVHDQTTSNLSKEESYVVLQCVIKLLELGYKPESIELEKKWRTSGKLDIFIKDNNGKAYTMIECKTKKKFIPTWDKMLDTNDSKVHQLFHYYTNHLITKFLILYTYDFENNTPKYHIIKITDEIRKSAEISVEECIAEWNKNSVKHGFFDDAPYSYNGKFLQKNNLLPLDKELADNSRKNNKGLFLTFRNILRKNSVSDDSNSFNKIFNLFLCKIVDETKKDEEVLAFQWFEGKQKEDYKSLLKRLNSLYKKGMQEFLDKEVVDYTDEKLKKFETTIPELKKIFDELRLYKNNEFAFIEVFNKESFENNAQIVKEFVEAMQNYQFRYIHKHQYLGDFFELLLNEGFKQRVGQFFTPVPLTQFIIKSLPLKEKMEESSYIIPSVIDPACGSGHFLTEIMEEMQDILNSYSKEYITSTVQESNISRWENPNDQFSWANDFIYGIDNDYRLIKTTKLACFLNGDGKANIIHTNGLYRFGHKDYTGKLHKPNQFDLLLTNPPYSVDGFLHQLDIEDKKEFGFSNIATSNTDDIECFFIERAYQLLKDKGIIGIVLPISILQNSDKLYTEARKILLQKFEIKALFNVGASGFMATGTNTVIVFAQKNATLYDDLKNTVDTFFREKKDVVCNGISEAFSTYVLETCDEMSFDDYKNNIDSLKDRELENEKDRMTTFMLTYNQVIPVIKAVDKDKTQKFLGYKFSNARGSEGLHTVGEGKLYNKDSKDLTDNKANYYVYQSFLGNIKNDTPIHKDLKDHIFISKLSHLLSWENKEDWSVVRLSKKKKIVSDYSIVKLGEYADYQQGITFTKDQVSITPTKNIVLTADHLTINNQLELKENKFIYLKETVKTRSFHMLNKDSIFICSNSGSINHVGKSTYISQDLPYLAGGFMGLLISKDQNIISSYFLSKIFVVPEWKSLIVSNGSNINNLQDIDKLSIPLPPIEEQNRIVSLMKAQDDIIANNRKQIDELKNKIQSIDISSYPMKTINNLSCEYIKGCTPKYSDTTTNIQIIKSGQARGYKEFDLSEKYYLATDSNKLLQYNDIMINTTGVGTAGRVTLFQLDGNYVSDSHISVLRVTTDEITQIYLYYAILNQYTFKELEEISTGASGQVELKKPIILNLKIPVPSIKEQEKIVAEITNYESQIDALNFQITIAKAQQKTIMSNVFTIEDVV